MMKKQFIKIILFVLSIVMVSCSLEPQIDNTFGGDFAFTNPESMEGFLLNAYGNIPNTITDEFGGDFLDAATDNAVSNEFGNGVYRLGSGGLTPNTTPLNRWNRSYTQFRNIHIFLENGLSDNVKYSILSEEQDALKRKNLKGEAFFLRAWWGFQLLQVYGGKTADGRALGYPIVTGSLLDEDSQDLENTRRNTYVECVDQILKDIDSAYANLPFVYSGNDPVLGNSNIGRADGQSSLALKSRVSLYAASPAYQPDTIITISGMGQYSVTNQAAYTNKWRTAAIHAQEAIDEIGIFTSLSEADFNSNNTPNEFIFRTYHGGSNLEDTNYPVVDFGAARTGPSQNLVDAFYSANGYPIEDPRSGYDASNPYDNRDPRLYLNVLYNDREFNNRNLEIYEGGVDSRSIFPNNTRTGYYVRKWMSLAPGLNDVDAPGGDRHYNPHLRKTELYLNLAEAANEAYGPLGTGDGVAQTAVDIIKEIRTKAGISDNTYVDEIATLGKDAFRTLIYNERRLELAFENHRYFDLRRALLPLNETVKGVKVIKNDDGSFQYETFDLEPRNFNDIKYYYAPLPYDELIKSPNLVNNLGW
ncbi:RagB/SusD family nutrient uptake outer membrane protein [Algibacter amylolyticus]|uniref:RagB/SusD family nutrient uptake outer membrane protein n=1 Tax=Algibacter amylolyticus TaxID=1608400 RepID=A0A5M7B720_9FLAO|nr:RagB/SusD family nutrient uptake outer membrane protein [Algibacter amylolyticus]KAA5825132.1 RagB/SusD family nutrient uptake outer membrane protein [Algibacter amylolyticus]MBB5268760.1 hypothetical protein [Algibacter amylolyticus]TSJ77626.1 RagB/SusD family nutrient uptake outer membrane protein [Algibacter amylolyticus]